MRMSVQIAHGSRRRNFDRPSRWSGGGTSSATEPARRDRSRPMNSSSTMHEQERHRRLEPAEVGEQRAAGRRRCNPATRFWMTPEQQAADERDRNRSQPAEHDRGQRTQHDEREHEVLQLEQRRDEHAAEAGEDHGEDPRDRRGARRVHPADAAPATRGRRPRASRGRHACGGSRTTARSRRARRRRTPRSGRSSGRRRRSCSCRVASVRRRGRAPPR